MSPLDTFTACVKRYGPGDGERPLLERQLPQMPEGMGMRNYTRTAVTSVRSDFATMLIFCSVVTGVPVDLLSVRDLERWITGIREEVEEKA